MATIAEALGIEIRGGARYPNRSVDITVYVDSNFSAYQYRAVAIDPSSYAVAPISGSPGSKIVGVLQNAPKYGEAVIRLSGVTRIIYGEAVTAFDLLKASYSVGNEAKGIVWDVSEDGHTHESSLIETVHGFYVTNLAGTALTGSTDSHFVKTLKMYSGGSFTTSSNVVTVTEVSGGEYLAKYTPTMPGVMYQLMIVGAGATAAAGSVITPSEFQDMPHATLGRPSTASCGFILGPALVDGIVDDEGLMILRPQVL